jgi:hypothetical protein
MITSAINVLRGDEELKVDPDRFESGKDVLASLRRARDRGGGLLREMVNGGGDLSEKCDLLFWLRK